MSKIADGIVFSSEEQEVIDHNITAKMAKYRSVVFIITLVVLEVINGWGFLRTIQK
ncbi:hypothetical protein [Flavobacterium sedimenticola]|uniref:Uncharacterized protein n=1 Tax=Flavobacterium sedimenticola TaxID=3043286 RepID=A0ABT6XR23_9FLAO|nr:hypothetical protein [Flavobacterium sedimenticola]MDI9257529.1 hypothetical protein [Flavobacterium sedimenticola]